MRLLSRPALLGVAGIALVALAAAGASLDLASTSAATAYASLRALVAICVVAGLVYLVAVGVVLRGALPRAALPAILLCAAAMRLIVLPTPPFLSSDVYRYIWDGRVQAAGINPYRYVPSAPELSALRDDAIYAHVNRAEYARTIYPPAAQLLYLAVGRISQSVMAMKLAMVAFELVAIAAMLALLRIAGLPRERVLIYAWNPLTVWEFAGNAHVDAVAIGFVALALLAYARRRAALTGAALALAVLCKLLPLALAPALWRRWDARMPLALAATIAGLYALYIGAGANVLGFLPEYVSEEGFSSGSGIYYVWALAQAGVALPTPVYLAAAAVVLGAIGCRVAFARPPGASSQVDVVGAARNAMVLATALLVAATPHYAWYFAWLTLPASLAPSLSVLALTVTSFFLYLDPAFDQLLWRGLVYGTFPVLLALELWWRRRSDVSASGEFLQRASS